MSDEATDQLRTVALGLGLVFWALLLQLLAVAGFGGWFALALLSGGSLLAPVVWGVSAFLLVSLVDFVGRLRCVAIPEESGVKSLGWTAVFALLAAIGLGGVEAWNLLNTLDLVPGAIPLPAYARLVAGGLWLFAVFLFLLFLQQTALYVRRRGLAYLALTLLLIPLLMIGGVVAVGVLSFTEEWLAPVVGISMLTLGVLLLVLCAVLLYQLRYAVLRFAESDAEYDDEEEERPVEAEPIEGSEGSE